MVGLTLVHTILLGRIECDSNIPSYICNTFLPKLSYSCSITLCLRIHCLAEDKAFKIHKNFVLFGSCGVAIRQTDRIFSFNK